MCATFSFITTLVIIVLCYMLIVVLFVFVTLNRSYLIINTDVPLKDTNSMEKRTSRNFSYWLWFHLLKQTQLLTLTPRYGKFNHENMYQTLWESASFRKRYDRNISKMPTRGHAYKLYKYRCKSVRADFFACRVVNVWNSLPESLVFTSLSAFKRSIRTVDFSVFLKCNSI